MTSGGWYSQEQRHGRHRQGATGAAWTPVVRPTDTGPAHARRDGFMPTAWPSDAAPAWPVSEVLTRRPGWPVDPPVPVRPPVEVPVARRATEPAQEAPVWPSEEADSGEPGGMRVRGAAEEPARPRPPEPPLPRHADTRPTPPPEPTARQDHGRHAAPPKRKTVFADMVVDTVPTGQVRTVGEAVVHTLSETTATGLRKFDLGNVPASVTPPRSWRRAAWFAVGTSAAVVLGLAVAAVELMGRPVSDGTFLDALPSYPSGPLTLDRLPNENTTTDTTDAKPTTSSSDHRDTPSQADEPGPASRTASGTADTPRDTVIGSTTGHGTSDPSQDGTTDQGTTTTTQNEPNRTTVGPAPVTPTDPQAMGDRTEKYFQLVTTNPAAAHAMTTGGMAREGAEGIEARYVGVRRVEVQHITIDRNQAVTTSTIKVVRDDGTETIEHRQLTFTWGGDPKITEDATTG